MCKTTVTIQTNRVLEKPKETRLRTKQNTKLHKENACQCSLVVILRPNRGGGTGPHPIIRQSLRTNRTHQCQSDLFLRQGRFSCREGRASRPRHRRRSCTPQGRCGRQRRGSGRKQRRRRRGKQSTNTNTLLRPWDPPVIENGSRLGLRRRGGSNDMRGRCHTGGDGRSRRWIDTNWRIMVLFQRSLRGWSGQGERLRGRVRQRKGARGVRARFVACGIAETDSETLARGRPGRLRHQSETANHSRLGGSVSMRQCCGRGTDIRWRGAER